MGDIVIFDLNLALTEKDSRPAPSESEAAERFYSAAASIGLDMSGVDFEETVDIVRVPTARESGKRSKGKSGWYVLHQDGDIWYGAIGNWQTDEEIAYTSREATQIDADHLSRIHARQVARRLEAEAERARNAAAAAALLPQLQPASPDHPYLKRKGIGPCGALQYGVDLLLPIYDISGNVLSYQTIDADGEKTFRAGCTSKGLYVIGRPTPNVVVCEGFATGASIHEATGLMVYVTFNAGNLASLTADIASLEARRGARVVIAADHDLPNQQSPNIGLAKAQQAAASIGGAEILMPTVAGADWNDVALHDLDALKAAFAGIRPLFSSWECNDPAALPARDWLYRTHYIRKFVSLTVAPGGLGKSTLALIEAVAMATGRPLLGFQPTAKLRWIYYNSEDPIDEIRARVHAICQHWNIPQQELVGQLFIASGRDVDIVLATGEGGDLIEVAFQLISGFVRFHRADGITLDPLANMHNSPETNELMKKLGKRLSRMADELNISVEIVHHTRKLNGHEASVEDARGGSALLGAVRVARVLNPMTNEEAARFGLATHIDHFRVEAAGKANLARAAESAEWYERKGVRIGNGDFVAVVVPWQVPDPFEGVRPEHAKQLQQALAALEEPAKESSQASDWAGHVLADVLGVDSTEPAVKARLKSVIKTWLNTGVLAIERKKNNRSGRETPCIVPGPNRM